MQSVERLGSQIVFKADGVPEGGNIDQNQQPIDSTEFLHPDGTSKIVIGDGEKLAAWPHLLAHDKNLGHERLVAMSLQQITRAQEAGLIDPNYNIHHHPA